MQLSPNFTLEELTITNTGIDNTPDQDETDLLEILAQFLEKIRHRCLNDQPVTINSAFRSAAVNAAVGGVPDSAHRLCFAADITCESFGTPFEVAKVISDCQQKGEIYFDQLIYEQTWVHVSRDPRLRGQRLTHWDDGTYEEGLIQGDHP